MTEFEREVENRVRANADSQELRAAANEFVRVSLEPKYSYNFSWLGRPIIQYPQDIVAMQEIIWRVQPDLIIETGIAHGGSLILSASMLELNALCGGAGGEVLGIDIEVRPHNREALEKHPLSRRIAIIEGSSIAPDVIDRVRDKARTKSRVLVCLDSNHTHEHVMAELEAYASLTSVGSYCIVFDTVVEDMPDALFDDRPWGKGNNPKTAVQKFLMTHPEFEVDAEMESKLMITVAPGGYLRRVK
jgi:cephalosporin hydroxylase